MTRIFISYRRRDLNDRVGRLYDKLVSAFGKDHVFMDSESLRAGDDYLRKLRDAVRRSRCFLLVIGPRWIDLLRERGEDDVLLAELEAAKQHHIRIIPLLFSANADALKAENLPKNLHWLGKLHALQIREADFTGDAAKLIEEIQKAGVPGTPRKPRSISKKGVSGGKFTTFAIGTVLTAFLLGWLGYQSGFLGSSREAVINRDARGSGGEIPTNQRPTVPQDERTEVVGEGEVGGSDGFKPRDDPSSPAEESSAVALQRNEPNSSRQSNRSVTPAPASRSQPLNNDAALSDGLTPLVEELSDRLFKENSLEAKTVALGAFTGPATPRSSSGPGIQQQFRRSLLARGLMLDSSGLPDFELKGDYRMIPLQTNSAHRDYTLRLKVELLNQLGDQVWSSSSVVKESETMFSQLGVSRPDFGPDRSGIALRQFLAEQAVNPTMMVADAYQASASTRDQKAPRPFRLSILTKDLKPIPMVNRNGLAFVELAHNQDYVVRLINDEVYDTAVRLKIDGLSVFAFSDEPVLNVRLLVPAKGRQDVLGWYRSANQVDRFVINQFADDAPAELRASRSDLGMITAEFSAAWDPSSEPPEDEFSGSRDPFTDRGESVTIKTERKIRVFGRVRDVIHVRYDIPEQ